MGAAAIEQQPSLHLANVNTLRMTVISMICADVLSTTLAVILAAGLSHLAYWPADRLSSWALPIPVLFTLAFALFGLYPGIALNPVDETRKILSATMMASLLLLIATIWGGHMYPLLMICIAGPLTVFTTILMRDWIRHTLGGKPWWGVPTVVIGSACVAKEVARALQKRNVLGLRIVGVLRSSVDYDDFGELAPTLGNIELAPVLANCHGVRYAILALPEMPHFELRSLVEGYCQDYEHLLIIPSRAPMASLWIDGNDIGGVIGLEMRRSGLHRRQTVCKRICDLILTPIIGILVLPLLLLIYLTVRMSSGGAALYGSTRIGIHGQPFVIWKFRSMVKDADVVLQQYLENHPDMLSEWLSTHKLRNDPRITPIGRILRRTSLDELPQIWNVLRGDMSLVGPRPIVDQEIPRYGGDFALYKKVRPGLTGLWQVSGRSDTSYEERVRYDEYYVRNWSIWLDFYVLGKTVQAVCQSTGAY